MVVISDIDDDPLIYGLGFAWRADNVLSLQCLSLRKSSHGISKFKLRKPFLSGAWHAKVDLRSVPAVRTHPIITASETRYVQRLR